MKHFTKPILLIFLLLATCSENLAQKETTNPVNSGFILTSSGQFSLYEPIIYENCEFDLVVNEQKDTIYLSTTDQNFITPEGYLVGTPWGSIAPEYQSKLEKMPGWGYYIVLNSGWQLGFCVGLTCTDSPPTDESSVQWVFRRDE